MYSRNGEIYELRMLELVELIVSRREIWKKDLVRFRLGEDVV